MLVSSELKTMVVVCLILELNLFIAIVRKFHYVCEILQGVVVSLHQEARGGIWGLAKYGLLYNNLGDLDFGSLGLRFWNSRIQQNWNSKIIPLRGEWDRDGVWCLQDFKMVRTLFQMRIPIYVFVVSKFSVVALRGSVRVLKSNR